MSVVSHRPGLLEGAQDECPRQAAVPEPLEREDVLDLARAASRVQLAVSADLAVGSRGEEPCVDRLREHALAVGQLADHFLVVDVAVGTVCLSPDGLERFRVQLVDDGQVGLSVGLPRAATMITSHSTCQPSVASPGASRSPTSASKTSTLRWVTPASASTRSASDETRPAVADSRSRSRLR